MKDLRIQCEHFTSYLLIEEDDEFICQLLTQKFSNLILLCDKLIFEIDNFAGLCFKMTIYGEQDFLQIFADHLIGIFEVEYTTTTTDSDKHYATCFCFEVVFRARDEFEGDILDFTEHIFNEMQDLFWRYCYTKTLQSLALQHSLTLYLSAKLRFDGVFCGASFVSLVDRCGLNATIDHVQYYDIDLHKNTSEIIELLK